LRVLAYDVQLEALRLLVDRRAELSQARIQCVNRVHRLLSELVPGQSKRDITTGQAKKILATVKPRDVAGKTRRRLAAEQIADLVAIEKKTKALTRELKEMVLATGSTLMELPGVGPIVAARTLADTGDVARFADRNRYASWTGTAPLEASSGEVVRHRLSRAGNRRMNHMIHIAAATQIRLDTPGRAYYRRKLAAGKSRREAMRCLKRRISDALYRQLRADAKRTSAHGVEAGPGGHCGAALQSSAAGLHPHTGTSDQPLPGPASPTLPAPKTPRKTTTSRTLQPAP
jgi:transposase